MSLVDQIFQQAQAGSAEGQGFGQFFTQGVALGQRQQELNMELAQLPLRQTLLQQDAALKSAQTEQILNARQNEIATQDSLAKLSGLAGKAMTEATAEDVAPLFLDALSRSPDLIRNQYFHKLWQDTQTSINAKVALQEAKNEGKKASANLPAGTFGTQVNPLTGKPEAIFYQSPNSAQLVKPPSEDTSATKNFEKLSALQDALQAATASGQPDAIAKAKRALESFQALAAPTEQMTFNPATGEFTMTRGRLPDQPTNAEETKYGEDLTATSNALRSINRLRGQLGSNVVGASPKIQTFLFDEVLSQLDPSLADKARAAGRQNIRLATQQILGELNNKGRLSNQELQAVREAMPSLGAAESSPNAQVKLDELSRTLAEKGAAAAIAIKRPLTPEILQSLSTIFPPGAEGERAMAEEVKKGALPREAALQVRKWQKSKGL